MGIMSAGMEELADEYIAKCKVLEVKLAKAEPLLRAAMEYTPDKEKITIDDIVSERESLRRLIKEAVKFAEGEK